MSVTNFDDLMRHNGHKIEIGVYSDSKTGRVANVAIECMDCYEVLLDFDNPKYLEAFDFSSAVFPERTNKTATGRPNNE